MLVGGLKERNALSGAHFEGMVTTLVGYCLIAVSLVIVHAFVSLLR